MRLIERPNKAAYWIVDDDGSYLGCIPLGTLAIHLRPRAEFVAQFEHEVNGAEPPPPASLADLVKR